MREQLNALQKQAAEQIASANTLEALAELELTYLGRKQGKLTALLRTVGTLPESERKSAGTAVNAVKIEIERLLTERRAALSVGRMANLADAEWIDVTAPGNALPRGLVHPVSEAMTDIERIFERIGFLRVHHPEVDSDYYAFEALNMPPDHPARDEWESFFVASATRGPGGEGKQKERIVLTPHTSNGQVREMEKGILPIRMINIGKCYRRQSDATHSPTFHQFEGLLIDRGVAITHLKGVLDYFMQSFFGPGRRARLRPFHFRFTEPSFEVDISCVACGGTGMRDGARCRTCKSGWLELGGAGMVHPNVLRAGGIDPNEYSGFAFGWGVERVLMMKRGIPDIRWLYANDLRVMG